jgi:hypothetical protein
MMKVLDFLGKLNSFAKSQGHKGNKLGDQIPDPEKAKAYVNSTLGIGFTTLNLLVRKGTEISDSLSFFMMRGDDKALLGIPDSEQRNLLIEQLRQQKPELEKFESYEAVIETIWSGEIKNYLPLLKSFLFSGIDALRRKNVSNQGK